jgi:hypothetical protein
MPRKKQDSTSEESAKKKSPRRAKAKAKANLEEMSQTHGMEKKSRPTTLAQIWGDDGTSRYGTMDQKQYEAFLQESSKSDLQTHASKIGVLPIDNTLILRERLLKQFKGHVAQYNAPQEIRQRPLSLESMRILSEGK